MKTICAIDEAGRGPVIGPLVISGVLIKESEIDKLKEIGVKDSKLILKKNRKPLFNKIKKIVDKYEILIIEPKEIDAALESDHLNLNWLEAEKTVLIINKLKPTKAIIDCPSPNINAYKSYIRERLKDKKVELIVEHKADHNYVECGAASILSKVTRDEIIKKLEKKYGDIGPGYTSNPITQKFLKENWDKCPEIFRKSWSCFQNHKNSKNQKNLNEF